MSEVFSYQGLDIPVDLLRMTGGGPESFGVISDGHIAILQNTVGIQSQHTVLEIGCGIGRDAIPLTNILNGEGRYIGIDIISRSIDWCSSNITKIKPSFVFYHFDIGDQLHNPSGSSRTSDFTIPVPDASVDRIILWSVFTHIFQDDILHYMREFSRVLKPDGLVWATFFIVNEAVLESARRTNLTSFDLRFEHSHSDGCYINDLAHPGGAVAFSESKILEMIHASDLELATPPIYGSWSGYFPKPPHDPGQDAVVLRKVVRT